MFTAKKGKDFCKSWVDIFLLDICFVMVLSDWLDEAALSQRMGKFTVFYVLKRFFCILNFEILSFVWLNTLMTELFAFFQISKLLFFFLNSKFEFFALSIFSSFLFGYIMWIHFGFHVLLSEAQQIGQTSEQFWNERSEGWGVEENAMEKGQRSIIFALYWYPKLFSFHPFFLRWKTSWFFRLWNYFFPRFMLRDAYFVKTKQGWKSLW